MEKRERDLLEYIQQYLHTSGGKRSTTSLDLNAVTQTQVTSSSGGPRLNVTDPAFGAVAGTTFDNAGAFNAAVRALPASGGTIYVPWPDNGMPYNFVSDWIIDKSNVRVEIDAGVTLAKIANATTSAQRGVIQIQGTITATTKNATANIDGDDVDIAVAGGDEAFFPAGSWIWIEDTMAAAVAVPAECVHGEWNRVKSTAVGVLNLYYPIHDAYTTAATAKVYLATPVENVWIKGEGAYITNDFAPSGDGTAHGIYAYAAIHPHISGLTGVACFNSCFQLSRCEGFFVVGANGRDASRLDSRGYGVTTYSCWDGLVFGGTWERLRHGVDFSVFSGKCVGDGQQIWGSSTTGLNTHSNVKQITYCNFNIDGCHSQNDIGAGVADDWDHAVGAGTTIANGINIDKYSNSITIGPGIIKNCMRSGILIDTEHTENVTLTGLDISYCNLANRSDQAGITVTEQNAAGTFWTGYRVDNVNVHHCYQAGIRWGISDGEISNVHSHHNTNGAGTPLGIGIWIYPIVTGGGAHAVERVKLTNVYCYNNAQDGVRVGKDASTSTVANCTLTNVHSYNNGGPGIAAEEPVQRLTISHAKCVSNIGAGINLQSQEGLVEFCKLEDNSTYGLNMVATTADNAMRGNIYSGNGSGPIADLGTNNHFIGMVNAREFAVVPNTGVDMSVEIQTAIDLGANWFEPGTYVCGTPISFLNSNQVIWAYGAVFDFGTANLTGTSAVTVGALGGTQVRQSIIMGLTIKRTYTFHYDTAFSGPGTGVAYDGLTIIATNRCEFRDLQVEGFSRGYYMIGRNGATGNGFSENVFHACRALNNRYSFTLEQAGADAFVNENDFYNCEHQHESAFPAAEVVDATYGVEICRILWAAVAHAPNNNRFWGCNWETTSVSPAHRKVRVEGLENYFYSCRWEGHNVVTADPGADGIDITIGKAATSTSNMTRNVFFHGDELNHIIDNARIEFIGTSTINNKNQFFTGWGSIWAGGNNESLVQMYGGTDVTDLIETKRVTGSAERTMLTRAAGPAGEHGYYGFYDNSTTERNYLSLATATQNGVWDILVNQGLRVGGVGQFYPSGGDLFMFPFPGGRLLAVGNAGSDIPVLAARNSDSTKRSFGIYTAGDAPVFAMFANPTSPSGQYGVMVWYDAGATEKNRLYIPSSGTDRSLIVDKGFSIGESFKTTGIENINDAAPAVAATTTIARYTNISAARAPTLPAAVLGKHLWLKDASGACSVINTITWTRAGADTIDTATTLVFNTAFQKAHLFCGAAGVWDVL
jgi:hypothetical protein